jgi:hypothetical protein
LVHEQEEEEEEKEPEWEEQNRASVAKGRPALPGLINCIRYFLVSWIQFPLFGREETVRLFENFKAKMINTVCYYIFCTPPLKISKTVRYAVPIIIKFTRIFY